MKPSLSEQLKKESTLKKLEGQGIKVDSLKESLKKKKDVDGQVFSK